MVPDGTAIVETPARSPSRPASLPGVRYSFDAAAALSGAAPAPRRSCWGAAGFSVPTGSDDGFAAGNPRQSRHFQAFNPWPGAC
jgi:hypothetical protein